MRRGITLFDEFFSIVFGTPTPAYQRIRTTQKILDELNEGGRPFPEETDDLISQQASLEQAQPFLSEMYKIVDGVWLAKNLSIVGGAKVLIHFDNYLNFNTAQEWWDFLQTLTLPSLSIVHGRSAKLWIWSYNGVSVMVEGKDAYILSAAEMQNQIFLNMIGRDIHCYLSSPAPINYLGRSELLWRLGKRASTS